MEAIWKATRIIGLTCCLGLIAAVGVVTVDGTVSASGETPVLQKTHTLTDSATAPKGQEAAAEGIVESEARTSPSSDATRTTQAHSPDNGNCGSGGDCCTSNTPDLGCDDDDCCHCICNCDPFCCGDLGGTWDVDCAGQGFLSDCGASNPLSGCATECAECLPIGPLLGACCDGTACIGDTPEEECEGNWNPNASCSGANGLPLPVCNDGCSYDNGPPLDHFGSPASQCGPDYPFVAGAADDFILKDSGDNPCVITAIRSWVAHFNGPGTPADYQSIIVTVYENADPKGPSGKPELGPLNSCSHTGIIVAQETVFPAFITAVETTGPCVGSFGGNQWQLDFPVNFELEKNVKYWLEIQPVMNFFGVGQVAWVISQNNTGHPAQQMFPLGEIFEYQNIVGNTADCAPPPAGTNTDLAFQLFGEKVGCDFDCGDGKCCGAQGEDCASCEADCGPCCGDGVCGGDDPAEDCASCEADCGVCCHGDGDCDYVLDMVDSFGDDWNGATLTVLVNGAPDCGNPHAAVGFGSADLIPVHSGDSLELIYASGAFESENSYEFLDSFGNVIFSDGPFPAVGSVFTGTANCDPPVPVGACCISGGDCLEDITEEECLEQAGGDWQGQDSECFNLPKSGETQVHLAEGLGLDIPDDAAPVGVSHTINVPDGGNIIDVDIDVNISHTWVGDLCVIVEHNGTFVTVVERIDNNTGLTCDGLGCCGCSQDNLDLLLDDGGGPPINDQCQAGLAGTFDPENPLSAFNNMDKGGDWTITVSDSVGLDTGTLNSWSVHITTGEPIPKCEGGEGECDNEQTLIIKQGSSGQGPVCPAPVNANSNGVLPILLVGTDSFNVADVDQASLNLHLCGGGPGVQPIANHTKFKDLNHPTDLPVGCPGCQCNDNESSDGIDDLSMKFSTDDVVSTLGLTMGMYTLELTGTLNDGSAFCARDCIVIVPPGSGPNNATMESNVIDTMIEVTPMDLNFDIDGFADFTRSYVEGTTITLTAPTTSNGRRFLRWRVDGVMQGFGIRTIDVTISGDTALKAFYQRKERVVPELPTEGSGDME